MDRRQFLLTSLPALAALSAGITACRDGSDNTVSGGAAPPPIAGAAPFPPLNFVTSDAGQSDYRPAIDTTGTQVIFERTPVGGNLTSLYVVRSIVAPGAPTLFLSSANPSITILPSQTRPDWCWKTGQVVVNIAETNTAAVEILIADSAGNALSNVPNSQDYLYPIWSRDGSQLIVYDNKAAAVPQPRTSLILPNGTLVKANLNGLDSAGARVFGGFAAPTPADATAIAFAGQPDLANWGPGPTKACPNDPSGYNQCYNYPFVNTATGGGFASQPLEPGASVTTYNPAYQGRAPYWSPNGKYVLFESDRNGGYAIFLANVAAGLAPVQVTDAAYGAQHAKFFPAGDKLILTALQQPGAETGPRGIAWVDISGYL